MFLNCLRKLEINSSGYALKHAVQNEYGNHNFYFFSDRKKAVYANRMELGVTNLLHLTFLLSCSAFFIMNVFVTLRTFIRRETIQTISQRIPDTPVYFPAIVVCSNNPFKDEDRPMLTLEDYEENSFNVEEYIESLSSTFHRGATTWKNTTLNTLMSGKCVAYEMEQEVSSSK